MEFTVNEAKPYLVGGQLFFLNKKKGRKEERKKEKRENVYETQGKLGSHLAYFDHHTRAVKPLCNIYCTVTLRYAADEC